MVGAEVKFASTGDEIYIFVDAESLYSERRSSSIMLSHDWLATIAENNGTKEQEQRIEQYPNPKNNSGCCSTHIKIITSLRELLHYCFSLPKEFLSISRNKQSHNWFATSFTRPFPSCFEPHYDSEAKYKAFHTKISFVCTSET